MIYARRRLCIQIWNVLLMWWLQTQAKMSEELLLEIKPTFQGQNLQLKKSYPNWVLPHTTWFSN